MTLIRRIAAEKRRYLVPIGIGLLVNVLLFAVVVLPLGRTVASDEIQSRQAEQALARARGEDVSARNLVRGKSEAETELQKFYGKVLPASQSAARRITYLRLEQLARESNVQSERGSANEELQKDSPLAKLTSTWVLTGDYQDVRRFIYQVETAPEFLVLENVALTRADQRERELTITLQVATYYRADHGN